MVNRLSANQINRIKDLAKAGVSIREIAEMLNAGKSAVYYHAKGFCRKMTKLNLDLLSGWERGYILGIFLGDGDVNKGRKNPRYIVRFTFDAERMKIFHLGYVRFLRKDIKKSAFFEETAR